MDLPTQVEPKSAEFSNLPIEILLKIYAALEDTKTRSTFRCLSKGCCEAARMVGVRTARLVNPYGIIRVTRPALIAGGFEELHMQLGRAPGVAPSDTGGDLKQLLARSEIQGSLTKLVFGAPSINVAGNVTHDVGLRHLGELMNLKDLSLTGVVLRDDALAAFIACLPRLTGLTLEQVVLTVPMVTTQHQQLISESVNLNQLGSQLTRLELLRCNVGADNLRLAPSLTARLTALRSLSLQLMAGAYQNEVLLGLEGMHSLEHLRLRELMLPAVFAHMRMGLLAACSSLRALELVSPFVDVDLETWDLSPLTQLTSLTLVDAHASGRQLQWADASSIASLPGLRRLQLTDCEFQGGSAANQLLSSASLTSLTLGNTGRPISTYAAPTNSAVQELSVGAVDVADIRGISTKLTALTSLVMTNMRSVIRPGVPVHGYLYNIANIECMMRLVRLELSDTSSLGNNFRVTANEVLSLLSAGRLLEDVKIALVFESLTVNNVCPFSGLRMHRSLPALKALSLTLYPCQTSYMEPPLPGASNDGSVDLVAALLRDPAHTHRMELLTIIHYDAPRRARMAEFLGYVANCGPSLRELTLRATPDLTASAVVDLCTKHLTQLSKLSIRDASLVLSSESIDAITGARYDDRVVAFDFD
jgi:hypothetical protein